MNMQTNHKRLGISVLLGAVLGVFCIIGVGSRVGMTGNEWYLFGMWYNRVLMGVLIGFAGSWQLIKEVEGKNLKNAGVRGLILGIIVSSAIFFSTGLKDVPAWFAGVAYGVIIDVVATHFSN